MILAISRFTQKQVGNTTVISLNGEPYGVVTMGGRLYGGNRLDLHWDDADGKDHRSMVANTSDAIAILEEAHGVSVRRTEPIHMACPTCDALPGGVCRERFETLGVMNILWREVHPSRVNAARERDYGDQVNCIYEPCQNQECHQSFCVSASCIAGHDALHVCCG